MRINAKLMHRHIIGGLISTLFILTLSSQAWAFRDAFPERMHPGERELFGEEEEVSLENFETHGYVKPRLTGSSQEVPLRFGDRSRTWLGQVSSRGVIEAKGRALIGWPNDVELAEMDKTLRLFVDQNFEAFRVRSSELRFNRSRTAYTGPFKYVTYDRVFRFEDQWIPVEGAFMTFRFRNGGLIQITNMTFGEIGPIEAPTIGAEEAVERIFEDARFNPQRDKKSSRVKTWLQPFAFKQKIGFRLVYEASIRKSKPSGLWRYSVSAFDGSIVRLYNALHLAGGGQVVGQIHPRLPSDPLTNVPFGELTVRSQGQASRADQDGLYEGDRLSAVAELTGLRADVRLFGEQKVFQRARSDGTIYFSASESLSENMSYFHVSRVNRFVSQFINIDFLKKPIVVRTKVRNGPVESCNAWFDPDENNLNFLEGDRECHDSSHIADIVYHEWGHSLDNALGGIQDGAFSEGIGDITSLLLTNDPRLAPGFVKGSENPIRDLRVMKTYPRDRSRSPHAEGLIIGGAWFEFLRKMQSVYGAPEGRGKVANLFFKHLVSADTYMDSYNAVLAIDDDDNNLENCTPHMCVMNEIFARRGLTAHDPRCRATSANLCADSTLKP